MLINNFSALSKYTGTLGWVQKKNKQVMDVTGGYGDASVENQFLAPHPKRTDV